ncbi:hypothetical protein QFZ35_003205 [Arthrobacter ulcerisalmonis]|nr:hypothetical protein [Arthrobacter ulcerisalmonis]MDQ0664707.1 hypothetical protein [Arthrobacter ulcerisalmonis]
MEKRKAVEQTVIVKADGKEARVVVRNGVVLLPKGFKSVVRRSRIRAKARPPRRP